MRRKKLRKHIKLSTTFGTVDGLDDLVLTPDRAVCGSQYHTGKTKRHSYMRKELFPNGRDEYLNYDEEREFHKKWNHLADNPHSWNFATEYKDHPEKYPQVIGYSVKEYEHEWYSPVKDFIQAESLKEMDCLKCMDFLTGNGFVNAELFVKLYEKGMINKRFEDDYQRYLDWVNKKR